MNEDRDLVSRIVSALCDKMESCDDCPMTQECGPSGNGFEKLVRKCLKEREDEKCRT